MKKQGSLIKAKNFKPSIKKTDLLRDLRNMIDQAKRSVASVVNTHLIALNWQIGRRIHSEILKKKESEIWRRNSCDSVARIDKRIWTRFYLIKS